MTTDFIDAPREHAALAGHPANEVGTPSQRTASFLGHADWLSFGLTSVVVLAVYLRTLAPEVTLEYSGALSTDAAYGGVGYPPGFPIWTVYSWLFATLLPVSNIAWRVAVGTAVAGALASGLVALMVSRSGAMLLEPTPAYSRREPMDQKCLRIVCGFSSGMALGLSRPVWSMAVVAEIWALTVLLFAILTCLLMCWVGRPERRRFLYGAFFVYGLLLTSNQEMLVMLPAILLLTLFTDRERGRDLSLVISLLALADWILSTLGKASLPGGDMLRSVGLWSGFFIAGIAALVVVFDTRRLGSGWRSTLLCAVFFMAGLGWYLYLPIASMTNPPMNWAYPRTAEGFLHGITRGQYEIWRPTDTLGHFLEQLWLLTKVTGRGFGWVYLVFAPLPLALLHRAEKPARTWLVGLLLALLCTGPLLVELLNPSAERSSLDLLPPYFAAMFVILAIWTGLGFMVAGNLAVKIRAQPDRTP